MPLGDWYVLEFYGPGAAAAFLAGVGDLAGGAKGNLRAEGLAAGAGTLAGYLTAGKAMGATPAGVGAMAGLVRGRARLVGQIDIGSRPSAFDIAQEVLNAASTQYNIAGTIGEKINAGGAAGDPWSTALPGAYGAGTAGNIIGNSSPAAIAAAVWASIIEGSFTAQDLERLIASALLGKVTATPTTWAARDLGDTKTRISATTTAGSRTSVSLDPT